MDPEFQKVFATAGLEAIPDSNTAKAKTFLAEELVRWRPVVKASGLMAH
jgi:tripartite-type tricarboxylate transporter receptor subunit TctC